MGGSPRSRISGVQGKLSAGRAIDRKAVQMTRNNDNLLPRLGWLVAIFVAFFGGC